MSCSDSRVSASSVISRSDAVSYRRHLLNARDGWDRTRVYQQLRSEWGMAGFWPAKFEWSVVRSLEVFSTL